jgi:nicotinamidase-related amidase
MQKSYPASELVVNQVVSEVRKAIRRNEWIMLVEYENEGRILTRITRELKEYKKVRKATKVVDNGAYAILWELTISYKETLTRSMGAPKPPRKISHIKICGVNTDACVISTVAGLRFLNCKITVLSKACANIFLLRDDKYNQRRHHHALNTMKKWRNVYVQ